MILTPYQVLAPAVSLLAIIYAWNLFMRRKKTLWEVLMWTVFWGAIAFIAFQPWVLTYLSVVTGIKDQESAVLITFLGILFFMIFYLVIRLEELEQRHTKLVRAIALRNADIQETVSDE
jgi:hypothetical protein